MPSKDTPKLKPIDKMDKTYPVPNDAVKTPKAVQPSVTLNVEAYKNAIALLQKLPYYLAAPILNELVKAEKLGRD